MAKQRHKLIYGYLSNFKGDAAIIFVGNREALENFAAFLDGIPSGPTNVTTMFDKDPLFLPRHGVRLSLTPVDSHAGMRRIQSDSSEPRFDWRISKSLASRFAELARAVAAADQPSHQYLDSNGHDDVSVILSKGEYDESWLQST